MFIKNSIIREYMKSYGAAIEVVNSPHGKYMAIPNKKKCSELYDRINSIPESVFKKDSEMEEIIVRALKSLRSFSKIGCFSEDESDHFK